MLVEDHEVVREGLRMVLESTGDIAVVAEATTAREGDCQRDQNPP